MPREAPSMPSSRLLIMLPKGGRKSTISTKREFPIQAVTYLLMAMNEGMDFNRVEYICCQCHNTGIIRSVWLSPTRIGLEGYCPTCQIDSVAVFDLLEGVNAPRRSPRRYGPPIKGDAATERRLNSLEFQSGVPAFLAVSGPVFDWLCCREPKHKYEHDERENHRNYEERCRALVGHQQNCSQRRGHRGHSIEEVGREQKSSRNVSTGARSVDGKNRIKMTSLLAHR
jgi:hypothetical protein